MTVALIFVAAETLALIGFATFAIVKLLAAAARESAALALARDQQSRAERAELQRDAAIADLATERARSKALEDYANDLETHPNADLAPDDVAGRIRRLLTQQAHAAATGDPVRGPAEPAVPADAPQEDGARTGPDDLLRPE